MGVHLIFSCRGRGTGVLSNFGIRLTSVRFSAGLNLYQLPDLKLP